MPMQTNGNSLLMSSCHSGVGTVAHPHMGIMKVHNTVPCESCFISKQNVSYELYVYIAFCQMPLFKPHPCMMVRRREDLHSLDVVWVKWLLMENSSDKGNTDTFSSCNSPHTGSGSSSTLLICKLLDNAPVSQQALVSGHMLIGPILLI
jgi:hypothetical protein